MKIGVLHKRNPRLELHVAVRMAAIVFENAGHAGGAGYFPAEAHLHPGECPADVTEMHGLTLVPDKGVRPQHIRITTHEMPDNVALEFNRAKATFAAGVQGAIREAA